MVSGQTSTANYHSIPELRLEQFMKSKFPSAVSASNATVSCATNAWPTGRWQPYNRTTFQTSR